MKIELKLSEKELEVLQSYLRDKKDGMSSDDYVTSIIKQILKKIEKSTGEGTSSYSDEEANKVKDRLEALGYMD
ncbi:hypothetical protein KC622_02365 [Candidatus Dojkabacteria bacterium]|uniref:CopG family transcriptional regulator n=1 Tax=Candidatus Dojkabacteria bacterium TaxID=2099670 RepID=A0A955KWN0_9BACT|nr:hypothetical protein [Candidatus Dojkabacteria bacterium]